MEVLTELQPAEGAINLVLIINIYFFIDSLNQHSTLLALSVEGYQTVGSVPALIAQHRPEVKPNACHSCSQPIGTRLGMITILTALACQLILSSLSEILSDLVLNYCSCAHTQKKKIVTWYAWVVYVFL